MTTPVMGKNCDLILAHKDIGGGVPYGFVLAPDPSQPTGTVSVQRERSGDEQIIFIFFTLVLADDLINPDGSQHTDTRSVMYAALQEYLAKSDNLTVITHMGSFLGIGPLGHAATELHMVNGTYVSIKLSNVTAYRAPIPEATFYACLWADINNLTGNELTWQNSFWV